MAAKPERFVNFDIGQPQALRDAVNSVMGASGTNHAAGLVGDPGSTPGTTRFWREDATFATPPAAPIATTLVAGIVKPDGTTITVAGDGTITAVSTDTDPGLLVSIVPYSGTQTITIPATATKAAIFLVGGGGGGGGSNGGMGGAGGAAGALFKYLTGLTAGNTLALTIGGAGTAGTATTNGGDGGASSLASGTQVITTLTANGGAHGVANGASGAGGTATNGDINIPGQTGASGGNSGGQGPGVNIGGSTGFGLGIGGMSINGGATLAGKAATGFGGGGSGGSNAGGAGTGVDSAGAAGTLGICYVWWFT